MYFELLGQPSKFQHICFIRITSHRDSSSLLNTPELIRSRLPHFIIKQLLNKKETEPNGKYNLTVETTCKTTTEQSFANTTQIKKKDELLNAHLSTLEFVKTKKPHKVMKALGKSFQLRPIPLLQLNSFGHSIKKSARGSKSGIAEKVRSESKS